MAMRANDPLVWPQAGSGAAGRHGAPRITTAAGGIIAAGLVGGLQIDRAGPDPHDGGPAGPPAPPTSTPSDEPRADDGGRTDRRRLLKYAAVAGGVAWVAPTVMSLNTPAAAASGPCTSTPSFVGYAEGSANGATGTTITTPVAVAGVPLVGTALEHIAIGIVDHIEGAPASFFTTPTGWTLLGFYDSDVTTTGTTGTGSTAVWSERLYVWRRSGALSASYSFDVTLTGFVASGQSFYPQARVVVAAYKDVGIVASNNQFALKGSGVISPLTPPPSASIVFPANSATSANTLMVALAGAGNVSTTNAVVAPPPGYTQNVAAVTGSGFPPIWLFSKAQGAGPVPSTSSTVVPGAPNVGGQLTLECH